MDLVFLKNFPLGIVEPPDDHKPAVEPTEGAGEGRNILIIRRPNLQDPRLRRIERDIVTRFEFVEQRQIQYPDLFRIASCVPDYLTFRFFRDRGYMIDPLYRKIEEQLFQHKTTQPAVHIQKTDIHYREHRSLAWQNERDIVGLTGHMV